VTTASCEDGEHSGSSWFSAHAEPPQNLPVSLGPYAPPEHQPMGKVQSVLRGHALLPGLLLHHLSRGSRHLSELRCRQRSRRERLFLFRLLLKVSTLSCSENLVYLFNPTGCLSGCYQKSSHNQNDFLFSFLSGRKGLLSGFLSSPQSSAAF